MSKSAFVSFEQVEEIHRNTIAQFGGTLGVRDKGALESDIFHPQNAIFTAAEIFSTSRLVTPFTSQRRRLSWTATNEPRLALR